MDDHTRREIIAEAKKAMKRLGKTQKEVAQEIGVKEYNFSRYLKGVSPWKDDERLETLARKLGIDITSLPKGEDESRVQSHFAYCPNPDCPGAMLSAIHLHVWIKPFFLATEDKYCPFCKGEFLLRACKNCERGIIVGAAICMSCGNPYLEKPEEFDDYRDPLQLADFVRETMAVRREIVREYLAHSRDSEPEDR
jgi:transcriptional regulator with XRE-family HTH domain